MITGETAEQVRDVNTSAQLNLSLQLLSTSLMLAVLSSLM